MLLVTGANKGIGYEVVRQLTENGFEVFLRARNEELGKKAVWSADKGDANESRENPDENLTISK